MDKLKLKELREINDLLLAINSSYDFSKISKPSMRLYVTSGLTSSKFFDSKEELKEYISNNASGMTWISIIEHYEYLAGRSDVIVKYENGQRPILKVVLDELTYAVYNPKRSIEEKNFIWEYVDGTLEEEYSAFRERGIIFKDDIYLKVDRDVEVLRKLWQKYQTKAKLKIYSNTGENGTNVTK